MKQNIDADLRISKRFFFFFFATHQQKTQLVGVTALLIAAKYEEMYPPIVSDLIYITDSVSLFIFRSDFW
jgi:hypothetical protein